MEVLDKVSSAVQRPGTASAIRRLGNLPIASRQQEGAASSVAGFQAKI